jgi:hypothetical protein
MTLQRRETSMLADISIGIGVCNVIWGLGFGLIWINLPYSVKSDIVIREKFRNTVRWFFVSVRLFGLPIVIYLLSDIKQLPNGAEPYVLGWEASCVVSLMIFIASVAALLRYGKR